MAKKVVTFGELMLRLAPEGNYRLYRQIHLVQLLRW